MKLPFILREEHNDAIVQLLKQIQLLEDRLRDVERQFAIEYDDSGKVTRTLADVPVTERSNVKVLRRPRNPLAGLSWHQRQAVLEKTDGLRNK
jgi:hypothetical protein